MDKDKKSIRGFPGGSVAKRIHLPMQETEETWIRFLGWEDPQEKEMASHFSILAWRIPWTEEPGSGLHSRLPRGVRPRLEGKPRTPLSSRVATRVSWMLSQIDIY